MINIIDKAYCCGCNACVQVCPKRCISMEEDVEGFLYPIVNIENCVDCGLCEKVCPVINQNEQSKPEQVYAAINPDEEIRKVSSSGGIFTMLAERIILEGGIVFGAKFNENWEVVHDWCDNIEDLAKFRGSKYVQSYIGDNYIKAQQFLKDGKKVLFSGTSCQIAGLRKFLRKEYDNLLTVDIVCHGVPSPLVWREYLKVLKKRPQGVAGKNTILFPLNETSVITGISFRDKSDGWKKFDFAVKGHAEVVEACENSILPSDANQIIFQESHDENLFMQGFLKNIYLRPSCYDCPAKSGKSGSDITLADYWGIQNHHPEMDDDKGTSLVLVNTSRGETVFSLLDTHAIKTSYEDALSGNMSIEYPVKVPSLRKSFYTIFERNSTLAIKNIINMMNFISVVSRIISKIKRLILK